MPFIPKLDSLEFKLQYDDKSLNPIPLEDAYYCSEEDSASTTTRNISDVSGAQLHPVSFFCPLMEESSICNSCCVNNSHH